MKRSWLVALLVVLAACSQESGSTTTAVDAPSSSVTPSIESSTTSAAGSSSTTPTTLESSTTITTTSATSESTGLDEDDTPTTTTTAPGSTAPSSGGITLVVAAYEPVLGVPIGTDFATASADLEEILGPPDSDTGWIVGCPLDGEEENERSLEWGSLRVDFYLTDVGRLSTWMYETQDGEERPAGIAGLQLPGNVTLGQPMGEVASTIGANLILEDAFDAAMTGEDGYLLWGFPASADAPFTLIGVPYVPVCE